MRQGRAKEAERISLDESVANATSSDIFAESLKSDNCIVIPQKCRRRIEEEMKKFFQCFRKNQTNQR